MLELVLARHMKDVETQLISLQQTGCFFRLHLILEDNIECDDFVLKLIQDPYQWFKLNQYF